MIIIIQHSTRFLAAILLLAIATTAQAWSIAISPGTRQIFIQVGNGTYTGGNHNAGGSPANNTTVNVVSANVPAASIGNGSPIAMSSNSTAANSFLDGYNVCNPPTQVYIGGWVRVPGSTGNGVMSVTTPTNLINGAGNTIPFSSISWSSTANGNATAHVAAGTFNGATLTLANIGANTWIENCMVFSYANSNVYPSGTYTGRAVYTLSLP